ncbi:MAG: SpoIIE family protein phosphatase [Desulfomonile sp.]|nr:SpoIIE family protein phosphatase [Desulfomonile sp.]
MSTLDQATEAILSLLRGQTPNVLLEDDVCDREDLARLFQATNALIKGFAEAQDFIFALSQGVLNVDPPHRNFLVSSFKDLHAHLRHLTWQTQQVARGDLSQRVDFLGDFSEAFNTMIEALREKRLIEKELQRANEQLREAHAQIIDSLQYGRTIQTAFLPNREEMAAHLDDFFVIWKPKDVIGGDIYRFNSIADRFLIAVIDCTGHGVPGSIMTMIAGSSLDEARRNVGLHDPAAVLQELNRIVKRALNQHHSESPSDDGLDIGICSVDPEAGRVVFSGAKIALYCCVNGEVREIKGDKQPIGYKRSNVSHRYTNHMITIDSPMSLYMTTDGLLHQIGGSRGFPFGKRRFIRFLIDHWAKPMGQQQALLEQALESYRGDEPQVDDITVLGFTIAGRRGRRHEP